MNQPEIFAVIYGFAFSVLFIRLCFAHPFLRFVFRSHADFMIIGKPQVQIADPYFQLFTDPK